MPDAVGVLKAMTDRELWSVGALENHIRRDEKMGPALDRIAGLIKLIATL